MICGYSLKYHDKRSTNRIKSFAISALVDRYCFTHLGGLENCYRCFPDDMGKQHWAQTPEIMISVLIPTTTGGLPYLAALMPQLSREKDTEIIVVDNNSRDGTVNYMGNYECVIKVNKVNECFSKANNQAARLASGDYLLLLNNDTVVSEGFIQGMLRTFDLDPKMGVVGCLLWKMNTSLPTVQHAGVFFTDDYLPYELGQPVESIHPGIMPNDDRVRMIHEVPSVTAACMLMKREVWDAVGGLDEEYINGWEDTDFCLKAREKGYSIWYNGQVSVQHRHNGTPGRHLHEAANRSRYDTIWRTSGRASKVL